jgi:hypothetical protein
MNVRLEYDMQWRAAIWFENCLQINNYNIELAITTNTSNADDHVVSLNQTQPLCVQRNGQYCVHTPR